MNWGNKLLVTFIVFGAGIFYLVFRSLNTNFELVNKDYYKDELQYQQVIDGSNRANALNSSLQLTQTNRSVFLQLPGEMKNKVVAGDVLFYCAYDEKKDRKFNLEVTAEGMQVFEEGKITPGSYTVKVNWNYDGQTYYAEKPLTIL